MRLAIALAAAAATIGISSFATAATRTLPLSASAQAVSPDGNTFTLLSPTPDPIYTDYQSTTTTYTERRAILEFDLSPLPRGAIITAADFHFSVSDIHPRIVQSTVQYPDVNFYGHPGNNLAEPADADQIDFSLGGETLNATGPWSTPLDTDLIKSYLNAHAAAVGITTYANSTNESVGFFATGTDAPWIEITYTLPGDANLDGRIDGDDYALIDKGYAAHLTGYSNGDFNNDGTIDQNDYLLIDQSFAAQSNTLSPDFLSQRDSQFGPAYVSTLLASVPEPSSLAAAALGTLFLARRRRA